MPLVRFLRHSVLSALQHIVVSRVSRAISFVYNFLGRLAKRLVKVDGKSLNGTSILDLETVRVSFPKKLIWSHLTLAEYHGYVRERRCVCLQQAASIYLIYHCPRVLGKARKVKSLARSI